MKNPAKQLAEGQEISIEVAKAFEHRATVAAEHLVERVRQAGDRQQYDLVD